MTAMLEEIGEGKQRISAAYSHRSSAYAIGKELRLGRRIAPLEEIPGFGTQVLLFPRPKAAEISDREMEPAMIYSSSVHRWFWAWVSISVPSLFLALGGFIAESHLLSVLSVFGLASSMAVFLIWTGKASAERAALRR